MKDIGNLLIDVDRIQKYSEVYLTSKYPKYIEIFSSDMKAVESFWLYSKSKNIKLEQGMYLIRLTLGNLGTFERIAEVRAGSENTVEFSEGQDDKDFKAGEHHFRADSIIRSEFYVNDDEGDLHEAYSESHLMLRDWNFKGHKWHSSRNYEYEVFLKKEGFGMGAFDHNLQILEMRLSAKKSLFISVPEEYELIVRERSETLAIDVANHYKITITLSNAVAQTLLSLLTRGDMISARALFNVKDAESLLLEKKRDPIAAAIGGYYLLKTGELEYMHNWANNLANWFEWLPDGCIIHAWQMILNKEKKRDEIKKRLLEAVNRGIPVFTEGLRLLYDGLTMLSYDFERTNDEVEMALAKVKIYMKVAVMSKENTTFVADKDFLSELI